MTHHPQMYIALHECCVCVFHLHGGKLFKGHAAETTRVLFVYRCLCIVLYCFEKL